MVEVDPAGFDGFVVAVVEAGFLGFRVGGGGDDVALVGAVGECLVEDGFESESLVLFEELVVELL